MKLRMVPAGGPMIMLSYGVSRGLDADELCSVMGLAPHQVTDPSRMVPFAVSLRLWRTLIARLPDENIGIGIGTFGQPEHYGIFWAFSKYIENGLEYLRHFARLSPFGDTACIDEPVTLVTLGDRVELRWPVSLKFGIPERTEGLNAAILGALSRLAGKPVRARCVRAAHPVDDKRRMAERHFGCEVHWNSADDALCFDLQTLLEPFPGAQPGAARALMDLVERKLVPDARLPFGEQVRRVVEVQLGRGDTSQRSVARALGMSARSLQRGLQEEGLRYGDLLGDVFKRAATGLMLDRARSLDDIAVELGYSETSSFARSWKRLTGESPARYRARVLRAPYEDVAKAAG